MDEFTSSVRELAFLSFENVSQMNIHFLDIAFLAAWHKVQNNGNQNFAFRKNLIHTPIGARSSMRYMRIPLRVYSEIG